jgi:hypothetical protein
MFCPLSTPIARSHGSLPAFAGAAAGAGFVTGAGLSTTSTCSLSTQPRLPSAVWTQSHVSFFRRTVSSSPAAALATAWFSTFRSTSCLARTVSPTSCPDAPAPTSKTSSIP